MTGRWITTKWHLKLECPLFLKVTYDVVHIKFLKFRIYLYPVLIISLLKVFGVYF